MFHFVFWARILFNFCSLHRSHDVISAVIECSFEENFCDWKINSDDHLYKWVRKTIENLGNNDYPRPDVNINDQSEYFVYAGYKMAGSNSTDKATAVMASPNFLVEEHPLECFHFWFYFGVSTDFITNCC